MLYPYLSFSAFPSYPPTSSSSSSQSHISKLYICTITYSIPVQYTPWTQRKQSYQNQLYFEAELYITRHKTEESVWMMRMGSNSLKQGRNHDGIIYEEEEEIEADHVGIDSSPSLSEVSCSVESLQSGLMEDDEATSSSSSSSLAGGPLHDMSSLMQHLPLKRGLSNYFQGKSQSFTSLSNVRCLEDLVKPDNPNNKKLKSCQSYGGLSSDQSHQSHRSSAPSSSSSNHFPRTITASSSSSSSSRFISRKAMPRGSCSSLSAKRTASFLANRPPIPPPHPHPHPHGSTGTSSFSNQTPLFA
ncbi:hypothetical protein TEA_019705 [Camellia sinensis var. sinensis]|uniref:Uncharacterized protein n=2 Tax=Camellia sinensis TaxID=4442 RepID=A0A4S4DGB6_CAMSN|nr:hypothetical protein TEA_019705 [Camellia sinensis var. sinensis]